MATNANIGAVIPETNKTNRIGSDNPGQQVCTNCRKTVQPRPVNGRPRGAAQVVMTNPTAAGYACPSCGHNFNWNKSTGKAGGPVIRPATNSPTTADM